MKITSRRALAGTAVVAVAVCAIGFTGGASAEHRSSNGSTIRMTLKGHTLDFTGPKTVQAGSKLTIKNLTNPRRVGPHTFTLVRKNVFPHGSAAKKRCFKNPTSVCTRVFKAHHVDFSSNPPTVGKPTVDDGKKGWDKPFGHHGIKGDSWVSEAKNSTQTRRVTAKAGTTLFYYCDVHLGMHGQIRVK